jgi:hypothetical protein
LSAAEHGGGGGGGGGGGMMHSGSGGGMMHSGGGGGPMMHSGSGGGPMMRSEGPSFRSESRGEWRGDRGEREFRHDRDRDRFDDEGFFFYGSPFYYNWGSPGYYSDDCYYDEFGNYICD